MEAFGLIGEAPFATVFVGEHDDPAACADFG
jgi:hypothetical protein